MAKVDMGSGTSGSSSSEESVLVDVVVSRSALAIPGV